MEYNNKNHLNLLDYSLNYKKQKKLWLEDPDKYIELNKYKIYLQNHIFWNQRKEFILLIKYFVDSFLKLEQFESDFSLL